MKKNNYFNIREFNSLNKNEWDNFCLNETNDTWLWHTYDGIKIKETWKNYKNISFYVIDDSNSKKICAVIPLFLISKKKKFFDYSTLELLGMPAIKDNLSRQKHKKLVTFIFFYLKKLLIKFKVNKIEFKNSPLTQRQILSKRASPNPLGYYINKDTSTNSWLINLNKFKNESEIFGKFDVSTRNIIRKAERNLQVHEIKEFDKETLRVYYELHIETTKRNNIEKFPLSYFHYIFSMFPENRKKIYCVKFKNKIINFLIFGTFNNKASYWTNACSKTGLKLGSNYLCMWHVIKDLKKKKFCFLETGEAFINSENSKEKGLNNFKKNFGCQLHPYYKGEFIENKYLDILFELLLKLKTDIFKN